MNDVQNSQYTATVRLLPAVQTDLVTFKPCWSADYRGETAVFATRDDAVEFCWKRWRVPTHRVHLIGAPDVG